MKISKIPSLVASGLVLSVMGAKATPPSDASITPPQVGGYWESKDNFYASVGGGAVFLNTPRKDNSNLFTDGTTLGISATNSVGSFKTNSTAGGGGGAFGYIFARKPGESWLGENMRVEVSGNYFQSSSTASGMVAYPTLGDNFWVEQLNGQATNLLGDNATGPTNVTLQTHDYFYDCSGVVKTYYFLGHNKEFTFTPSLGFDFSHLAQHFQTYMNGIQTGDADPTPVDLNQGEKVTTDYYEMILGFDLRANVSKDFVMFLDGSVAPGVATSSYYGTQGSDDVPYNYEGDHTSRFAFTASLTGGFSYDFGPVILTFSGGFKYWDYVGTVKESEIPNNVNYFAAQPASPSHLASGTMLNPQVTSSVVIPF